MNHTVSVRHIRTGVTAVPPSPYLSDVLQQPQALSALLDTASSISSVLGDVDLPRRPRVVISGMGSSHVAGLQLWTALIRLGVPAWWIDSAQLLDVCDAIVTPDSVLWLTSQSGESGETVALLDRFSGERVHIVGVTNSPGSALGRAAHTRIDLLAGNEATVSTKSYVNSLAVARLLSGHLAGAGDAALASLRQTVDALGVFLSDLGEHITALDGFASGRHLVLTGRGLGAASAAAGGLILKEASKVPVEGMAAGALRHGPIELAGPGLAVVFFDHGDQPHRDQNRRLAGELSAAGSDVAWVADGLDPSDRRLPASGEPGIDLPIRDALAFQALSFGLARRSGVEAGAFRFASKVTDVV